MRPQTTKRRLKMNPTPTATKLNHISRRIPAACSSITVCTNRYSGKQTVEAIEDIGPGDVPILGGPPIVAMGIPCLVLTSHVLPLASSAYNSTVLEKNCAPRHPRCARFSEKE